MAARYMDPLPQFLNEFAMHFTKEQEAEVVEMFSSTLDARYRNASTLRDVFDLLRKDNRVSLNDTFVLEKCIEHIKAAGTEKMIKEFKTKHNKEIEELKRHETSLVRRQKIYERVDRIMKNSHGVLLHGEAGVGKTFLAKDYLNLNQKDNFKEVDLRDVDDSNVLIVKVLQKFGFSKSIAEVDLNVLKSCLKKSAIKKRVILFLDNTDDFIDKENKTDDAKTSDGRDIAFSDVVETVVKTGGGLIKLLITSRNPSGKDKVNRILKSHRIGQLEKHLALKLLRPLNMSYKPSGEMLDKALQICKFLPLNLDLVGGMLQDFGTVLEDIDHITWKYAESERRKIEDKELAKKKEIEISTLSILEANFDKLGDTVQQGAVALSLFRRPFKINDVEFMFEDMMKTNRLNLILHALKHLKVIQLQDDMVYDFHPMVRSFLEKKSKIDHINPFYQQAKMKFVFKFRTHFKMIAELLQNSYDHAREVFQHDFGNFKLTLDIHVADGIPFFKDYYDLQHASGLFDAVFKKDWRIDFFQQVAKNYVNSGDNLMASLYLCAAAQNSANLDPHLALKLLSQAKEFLEDTRKAESADVDQNQLMAVDSLYSEAMGNSLHHLSKNSKNTLEVVQALEAYKEAYKLRSGIYGENASKPDLASVIGGLGSCQSLHASILKDSEKKKPKKLIKEKLKVALDCFRKSLKMYEKCSRYSSEIPITLLNIGTAYFELGDYKNAHKYFGKVLQKEKDLKIDGFHSTARIMFNIANTCRDLNKDAEARRFSREAYLLRRELVETHPDTVKSLYQLAVIHHEQGMYIDAIEYYKKAFRMEEELPDDFHSPHCMDIREDLITAFKLAIKKGSTHLIDDLIEWEAMFLGLDGKEEEKKKHVAYQPPQQAVEYQQLGQSKATEECLPTAWFQVYGRRAGGDWDTCVACSQEHHMQLVDEQLSKTLRLIALSHYNERIFVGTKMKVHIYGSFCIPEGSVLLHFKSTGPCYTKLFRVRNVESGSKGNDLVIRSEEDDEYTRFPLSSLTDDSGSMTDGSSDSGSENGITGDPEPYRFFGLRLEKCDFGGVRLGIDEVLQLEKHKILPDEYIEKIKSEVKRDALISALKLALSHLAKYYCKRPLKEGCLEVLFGKPGSLGCQSCLRKVLDFLERPCKDMIYTSSDISKFLELIYTEGCVFKHSKVQKYFFRELGLKPGDRENIEREAKESCDLLKRMLEQSFCVEYSKVHCLFDVVKALLRTKARVEDHREFKKAKRVERLLDKLGKRLEDVLFKDDW